MSVTFRLDQAVVLWEVSCSCGQSVSSEPVFSYDDGLNIEVSCGNDFCASDPNRVSAIGVDDVNVSNINARLLLNVLGFGDDVDLMGKSDGEDMMGRVLLAEAVNPFDEGVPAVTDGIMVDCGRNRGYVNERLSQLRVLAERAVREKCLVVWS